MTKPEYNNLISQLPENLSRLYRFNPPTDYSRYKCIHTDQYDYYPDIHTVIISGVPVVWDSDLPYADPAVPEHLAEMKRRIAGRLDGNTIGIVHMGKRSRKMKCILCSRGADVTGLAALPFDGTEIYYDPDETDLAHDKDMKLLAECLFAAARYDMEYIVPSSDLDPEHWE